MQNAAGNHRAEATVYSLASSTYPGGEMTALWAAGIGAVVLLGLLSRIGERSTTPRSGGGDAPPSPERIDELLRAGRKIDAIKAYRVLHRVDLKTAKDAIDARARELGS
jgi:hypothetical protein